MGVRATAYLQVEPEWGYSGTSVIGAKVARMTQRAPRDNQLGGTVLVKVTLLLDEEVFLPLEPEALVEVAPNLTVAKPIEIEIEDPND